MANEKLESGVGGEDDALEVNVIDDTPPEDQGRKPIEAKTAAAAADDEVEQYSDAVKKRLGALKHQYHDERRSRESAERERDEAVRVAQTAYQRTKALEQQLTYGEASYAGEVQDKAVLSVASAKEKYRKAFDAGDPEKLAEAAGELAEASLAAANAKQWKTQAVKKSRRCFTESKKCCRVASTSPSRGQSNSET